MGVEELADLLTLVDSDEEGTSLLLAAERGEEFYWALKAPSLGGLPHERRKFTAKTIWRRCFLRDRYTSLPSASSLASYHYHHRHNES